MKTILIILVIAFLIAKGYKKYRKEGSIEFRRKKFRDREKKELKETKKYKNASDSQ